MYIVYLCLKISELQEWRTKLELNAPSLSAYVGYSTVQLYSTTLKLLRVQYLHYKPVLNHFSKGGGEVRELCALVLFSTPVIL
jgi:hypothetical protein